MSMYDENLRQAMRQVVKAIAEYHNGAASDFVRTGRLDPFCGPRLGATEEYAHKKEESSDAPFAHNDDEGFLLSKSKCMDHVDDANKIFDFIWTHIRNKRRDIYGGIGVEEWTSRPAIDYYLETNAHMLMQLILAALRDSEM